MKQIEEDFNQKLRTESKYRIGKTSIGFILQCNPSLCNTQKQAESVRRQPTIKITTYEK